MKKVIVVGIGNPNFKDDGIGYKVVESLGKEQEEIETLCLLSTDLKVLDVILDYDLAIIVDGVKTGLLKPGTIIEIDPLKSFDYIYASGTHSLTLFEVIRIGYQVFPERMPKEIKIIGIEVEEVALFDKECSPEVNKSIPEVIKKIKNYLLLRGHQNLDP
ncbi:MAG: hydrogenase maturation protease [Thermodesulfobacteriaceae bacterium]|nr:hydrogenase maturation protease [Thermodesulfobacteriaceae bacterium]MCX8041885.1 hydrogenase maturation protease [Thermodesulfobacteriaceae bacterium]MDW8135718.1 hydrogenase maturation protease [Thermodesulfobacterium sp.]